MSETEKVFADGFSFSKKETDQDFVVTRMGVNADRACEFLQKHKNERGYVNIDVLTSGKTGNQYGELNTWKPEKKDDTPVADDPAKIPF